MDAEFNRAARRYGSAVQKRIDNFQQLTALTGLFGQGSNAVEALDQISGTTEFEDQIIAAYKSMIVPPWVKRTSLVGAVGLGLGAVEFALERWPPQMLGKISDEKLVDKINEIVDTSPVYPWVTSFSAAALIFIRFHHLLPRSNKTAKLQPDQEKVLTYLHRSLKDELIAFQRLANLVDSDPQRLVSYQACLAANDKPSDAKLSSELISGFSPHGREIYKQASNFLTKIEIRLGINDLPRRDGGSREPL